MTCVLQSMAALKEEKKKKAGRYDDDVLAGWPVSLSYRPLPSAFRPWSPTTLNMLKEAKLAAARDWYVITLPSPLSPLPSPLSPLPSPLSLLSSPLPSPLSPLPSPLSPLPSSPLPSSLSYWPLPSAFRPWSPTTLNMLKEAKLATRDWYVIPLPPFSLPYSSRLKKPSGRVSSQAHRAVLTALNITSRYYEAS